MKTLLGLSLVLLFCANAHAFDYDKMCTKVKSCALEEIKKTTEVPEGMEQVFEQLFDAQCATILTAYTQKFEDANIEAQANACADTILEMSCEDLVASKGEQPSQVCKDFEAAAKEAGIDLDAPQLSQ